MFDGRPSGMLVEFSHDAGRCDVREVRLRGFLLQDWSLTGRPARLAVRDGYTFSIRYAVKIRSEVSVVRD